MPKQKTKRAKIKRSDIYKIIATKNDVTVHVYDFPDTKYDGNFKAYIVDPDPDLALEEQYYSLYTGTSDDETVEFVCGYSVLDEESGKARSFNDIEYLVFKDIFTLKGTQEEPLIHEMASMLYRRHYFNSDEYYEHLYDLINNSEGKRILISKDENLLEYEPFGEIVRVDLDGENGDGVVHIHLHNGDDIAVLCSELFDLIDRHDILFEADPDDDVSDKLLS